MKLTDDYIKYMVKRYDFYDNNWNISGSFDNNFVDNGDGTVTDRTTGLMWQKGGTKRGIKGRRVKAYVEGLNEDRFAGYSDWRLPTIEELASLLAKSKTNGLHIDPLFGKKQKSCWSADKPEKSTQWAASYEMIWVVDFARGRIKRGNSLFTTGDLHVRRQISDNNNYVRVVRSLEP